MKMLQEARALAKLTGRHTHPAPPAPMALPARPGARTHPSKQRRFLRISMRELPDIPVPVPITHLRTHSRASVSAER
jgi:hypothetical protein